MARGVNKAILVGTLGKDPETRHTQSGKAVTTISIATNESWKDKQTGQQQERTEWHRVVFFDRLAEIAGEYLKVGKQVYVEGKITTRKWQDQSGKDCYTTEIQAKEMQIIGGNDQASQQPRQQNQQNYQQQPQQNRQQPQQTPQAPAMDDFEDSIPF